MQIVIESLALAAFGDMLRRIQEPLLNKLLRYVMSDEARHVAFGVLSLQSTTSGLTEAELKDRQEFLVENTLRSRARSTTPEIWERMGVDVDDGAPVAHRGAPAKVGNRGNYAGFQSAFFAKLVPNVRKLGLLDANDGYLRKAWGEAGLLEFEFADDTGADYEPTTRSPRTGPQAAPVSLRGAAAIVGVADAASPTGELELTRPGARGGDDPGGARRRRPHPRRRRRRVPRACRRCGSPSTSASTPRFTDSTNTGGSSFEVHVEHAAAAITAGLCDVVVSVYASTPRSDRRSAASPRPRLPGAWARTRCSSGRCLRPAPAHGPVRDGGEPAHGRVRHHVRAARRRSRSARVSGRR